ncbi:MAG: CbtA family protein [Methylococcales bacterium]|nr:CbtA family protein [Methylococcales bacterium]
MYFRNLVLSAFAIAMIAGLFLTVYQEYFITPIILDSEVYEVIESAIAGEETVEAWGPEAGAERSGYSFVANVLVCFAYALVLLSGMAMRSSINIMKGAFWGGAAYLSIFAAPALGLPPEIPGMEAAVLEDRQAWWVLTVCLTAVGLWLVAFSKPVMKLFGLFIIALPHLLGAPQPERHGFANTDPQAISALTDLWHHFIVQASVANALLWLIIGLLSAYSIGKFIHPLGYQE